ncbi:hypothetical protein NUW54_g14253 [Trametes sanguinea]|uniref:Uncharacterized protein n=1 Tax=Trametes sanguinea TaxID=158606 RepID=A0ACC1MFN3_9APHY|nr:hypothetical protein NUW54_g14253 [Trametes sanguinea]
MLEVLQVLKHSLKQERLGFTLGWRPAQEEEMSGVKESLLLPTEATKLSQEGNLETETAAAENKVRSYGCAREGPWEVAQGDLEASAAAMQGKGDFKTSEFLYCAASRSLKVALKPPWSDHVSGPNAAQRYLARALGMGHPL